MSGCSDRYGSTPPVVALRFYGCCAGSGARAGHTCSTAPPFPQKLDHRVASLRDMPRQEVGRRLGVMAPACGENLPMLILRSIFVVELRNQQAQVAVYRAVQRRYQCVQPRSDDARVQRCVEMLVQLAPTGEV